MTQPPISTSRQFGTFTGVFTPTLLTILGVIMYLRLGWVVGNAGLGGAWLIMGLAMGITACTGLSLSSIATNTRIGAGGPYAIIARSLGLEIGGSVGIPLYLTRPLGVAMYIFGFREGWLWLMDAYPIPFVPESILAILSHPMVIDLATFALLFAIAFRSANLAFRIQYAIMAVIVVSLLSIVFSPRTWEPLPEITWWGSYVGFPERGFQGIDFWQVFAVFFPATTGILAGANMSGDLKDPRRAIPQGTLTAIAISTLIYFALAWWAAMTAPLEELATNYAYFIDASYAPPLVLLGLLGATFSSALAGLVGGPRILMAMGQSRLLPRSEWLAKTSPDGEPRNALLLTGALTILCVMLRDLNVVAPLLTMFFLITYGVLNLVVLFEQTLQLVSFRPTLRLHPVIPLLGLLGCLFAMFIVSPAFGLLASLTVVVLYVALARMGVDHDKDVRSSVFVALAEWAAARVTEAESNNPRAWKPNLLVPVDDPETVRGQFHLLLDVAKPEGSIHLLGLSSGSRHEKRLRVRGLSNSLREKGVLSRWAMVDFDGFVQSVWASLQALQGAFFRPNLLFLTIPEDPQRYAETVELVHRARDTGVGVLLLGAHPRAGLGQRHVVNVWVRADTKTFQVSPAFDVGSLNLILLMGYRLLRTWPGDIRVYTVIDDVADRDRAKEFLDEICDLCRYPDTVPREVLVGQFETHLSTVPVADLNILGLQPDPDLAWVQGMVRSSRSTCLFVLDSGRESALA